MGKKCYGQLSIAGAGVSFNKKYQIHIERCAVEDENTEDGREPVDENGKRDVENEP